MDATTPIISNSSGSTSPPAQMMTLPAGLSGKDSRWLTLEVCREFQRSRCTRSDLECKFAHPQPHVEVQNGRVTCCFDSIKGKCSRKEPPCKYLHPPQHLKELLLQNGRNNLIFKAHAQQLFVPPQLLPPPQSPHSSLSLMPTLNSLHQEAQAIYFQQQQAYDTTGRSNYAAAAAAAAAGGSGGGMLPMQSYFMAPHPYFGAQAASGYVNPYAQMSHASLMHAAAVAADGNAYASPMTFGSVGALGLQQKASRGDRLEVCRGFKRGECTRTESACKFAHPPDRFTLSEDGCVVVCMDFAKGKCTRDACKYYHPPAHLLAKVNQQRFNAAATSSAAAFATAPSAAPRAAITDAAAMVQNMTASEVLNSQQAAKKRPRDTADELILQSSVTAVPVSMGMPYLKRQAVDSKSGLPMYQPASAMSAAAYQHYVAAMSQQPGAYIPISSFAPLTANTNLLGSAAALAAAAASNGFGANTDSVTYFDDNNQFLDTLPVCRDFRTGQCSRPQCKYVHLGEDHVEVVDGKVTVCRDFVKNKCTRTNCKYYHLPRGVLLRGHSSAAAAGLGGGGANAFATALTTTGVQS